MILGEDKSLVFLFTHVTDNVASRRSVSNECESMALKHDAKRQSAS